eukprot:1426744-Pleurochrysis_carterae.AAC.6
MPLWQRHLPGRTPAVAADVRHEREEKESEKENRRSKRETREREREKMLSTSPAGVSLRCHGRRLPCRSQRTEVESMRHLWSGMARKARTQRKGRHHKVGRAATKSNRRRSDLTSANTCWRLVPQHSSLAPRACCQPV